jgi:hypothetical protein
MKSIKIFVILLITSLSLLSAVPAMSQCAMCSVTAEAGVKNGNTQSKGLNNGIMFLLAAPYLAAAALGYIWYKKYRRKNVNISIKEKDFHLN